MKRLSIQSGNLKIFIVLVLLLEFMCTKQAVEAISPKLCKHFQGKEDGDLPVEKVVRKSFSAQCPPSPAVFSIFNVYTSAEEEEITNLTLLFCWSRDVKRIALHFDISVPDVVTMPTNVVKSCSHSNDTIYITRQAIRNNSLYQLVVNLPATNDKPFEFKAFYDHKRQMHTHGRHKVVKYRYTPPDFVQRKRRSLEEDAKMSKADSCGKTRGCYRQGPADCEHLSCTYFVSYNLTVNTVDLDISAKTPGWVAIGFSSDSKMGGDDIIVCAKESPSSMDVVAHWYKNPYSHDQPERKDSSVTLHKGIIKDGYIYCHVTCPVESQDRQDLTNDWYQFYASGEVSQGGGLEKHKKTPWVSGKALTMLRHNNHRTISVGGSIFNFQSSAASHSLVSVYVLLYGTFYILYNT